jgi:uncharacterized protein (DUF885 family)
MRTARLLLAAGLLWSGMAALAADAAATQRLHALFERYREQTANLYPEWATWRGDHRFDDRLSDASPAGRAAADAREREWLAEARAFDPTTLDPTDRVSLDLFIHGRAEAVALQPFEGWRSMSLGADSGFQTELPELLQIMPMDSVAQVDKFLARLAAVPRRVDEELHWLKRGIALGWVPPRAVLQRVLAHLDQQLQAPAERQPWLDALQRMGSTIPPATQAASRERATEALRTEVLPALQRLRDFVAGEYLAAASVDGALSGYSDGPRVYELVIAEHTTLPLTARQLHDTGLREVARLQRGIEAVWRESGHAGSLTQWLQHLNSDPRYFHPSGEALLADYRDIAKRIDPELPKLFAELPRAPYGIRAMPSYQDAGKAEYYEAPALDGSRAGWFNANARAYRQRPTWSLESLVAHETVPGHHLQQARAVELTGLPAFRRDLDFTAYVEGWALYAETLGAELGLYRDAASRYGYLQMQIFRAARLVVDTGLHAFGWSRERAIDYLAATSGLAREHCAAEVDRYTSWPGQALAYTTGQLKIVELRERAQARLGERFDLRRFHNAVLDQGALPLPVLERLIDGWIAAEAAK